MPGMGPMRFGAGGRKRDTSEPGIVKVFRDAGYSVAYVSGKDLPDLIVGHHGTTSLVEVKSGPKARLTPEQVEWHAAWQGEPVQIARSAEEAVQLVKVWRTAAAIQRERDRRWGRVNEQEAP